LKEDVERYNSRRAERAARGDEGNFVEFVEFGMEDVEQRFQRTLGFLKETARLNLNNLAAGYLREVIRGEAETYAASVIQKLDESTITKILNRVEEKSFLTLDDKKTLREVIEKLKATTQSEAATRDKYIAHFFSKLVDIHNALSIQEASITKLVDVCNEYLEGKKIRFDETKYELALELSSSGKPLRLSDLSSGEKQIVSLFTHIYLGRASNLVVLIDEPELSLSVEWQRRLLPDILQSGRCSLLVAVTHSPFTFDNELNEYAVDLRSCISTQ
jgi:predicted ATP-dependent endonuclease of OLD family